MKKFVKLQFLLSPAFMVAIAPKLEWWLIDCLDGNLHFLAVAAAILFIRFLVYAVGILLVCMLAFNWDTCKYERTTAVYLIIPIAYMLISFLLSGFLFYSRNEGIRLILSFVVLYAVLLGNTYRSAKSVQQKSDD